MAATAPLTPEIVNTAPPVEEPTSQERTIEQLAELLPIGPRQALLKLVELMDTTSIDIDQTVQTALGIGEAFIDRGLDATIDWLESIVEQLYAAGWMDRLGRINSFLRDGAEIGIQITLNTLKAMEPADVAKLATLIVVLIAAPNLFVVNGAAYLALAAELLGKLWHLP